MTMKLFWSGLLFSPTLMSSVHIFKNYDAGSFTQNWETWVEREKANRKSYFICWEILQYLYKNWKEGTYWIEVSFKFSVRSQLISWIDLTKFWPKLTWSTALSPRENEWNYLAKEFSGNISEQTSQLSCCQYFEDDFEKCFNISYQYII